jgi:hypothetical protein
MLVPLVVLDFEASVVTSSISRICRLIILLEVLIEIGLLTYCVILLKKRCFIIFSFLGVLSHL